MSIHFRSVALPKGIKGRLLLHSMPGFAEAYQDARAAIVKSGVQQIVCLNPNHEIRSRSPEYFHEIQVNALPCALAHLPMTDMTADAAEATVLATARDTAARLRKGETVLVHCAYGIGRTGTFASVLLMTLGQDKDDAIDAVYAAGSRPEAPPQLALIRALAAKI